MKLMSPMLVRDSVGDYYVENDSKFKKNPGDSRPWFFCSNVFDAFWNNDDPKRLRFELSDRPTKDPDAVEFVLGWERWAYMGDLNEQDHCIAPSQLSGLYYGTLFDWLVERGWVKEGELRRTWVTIYPEPDDDEDPDAEDDD